MLSRKDGEVAIMVLVPDTDEFYCFWFRPLERRPFWSIGISLLMKRLKSEIYNRRNPKQSVTVLELNELQSLH